MSSQKEQTMSNQRGDASGVPKRSPSSGAIRGAAEGRPRSRPAAATLSRDATISYGAVALERARAQFTRCLERASNLPWVDTGECGWLRSRLAEKTFSVLFVGQSRQGTAGVINALLGERVLPPPISARSAALSVVRYGPIPTARLESSDRPLFAARMSEPQGAPVLRSAATNRRLIVERPSPWLAGGVELLHTPPVGSLSEYDWHIAHRYLASVDAIVFVSSAWQPLSRLESEFMGDLVPYAEKMFFVLDEPAIPKPGHDRSAVARAKQIGLAVDPRIPIFAVSAARSLASKLDCRIGLLPDPAFVAFERELRHFLDARRRDAWLQPVGRSLLRILSHARARLNLERSALAASDDEIARWSTALERGKERLDEALCRVEESLRESTDAILSGEVDAGIESFADRERRRIHAATVGGVMPEEEKRALVRAAYAGWLLREARTVARAFDSLSARFWGEVQSAIDAFMRDAAELYADRRDEAGMFDGAASEFRYRFWRHPATVRLRWMLCDASFPRLLGGSRQDNLVGESALDQIQIHAGRIRRDFKWRIGRGVEDVRAYARARIASMSEAVRTALRCAAELRRESPERGGARAAQLVDAGAELLRVEARVRAICVASARRIGSTREPNRPGTFADL
jgi:hypothetical protein